MRHMIAGPALQFPHSWTFPWTVRLPSSLTSTSLSSITELCRSTHMHMQTTDGDKWGGLTLERKVNYQR